MTPQHTLVLVHGRRSLIAWGWVCVVNVALCGIVLGVMLSIDHSGCDSCPNPKNFIKTVEQALVAYQTDHDDVCPKQIDDLFTEHYLTKPPRDRYREPFVFTCPGVHNKDGADIVSKGHDRILGTADDLNSWEL
jgi:hypothetical protein